MMHLGHCPVNIDFQSPMFSFVTKTASDFLLFFDIGLKSSGWNGIGFRFGSRWQFAMMAHKQDVCAHIASPRPSNIWSSSRSVKGPGSTPITPAIR
jgi:hypothetical protein